MKGLSIVGAVAALALCCGASSASASTVFCNTNASPCPAGNTYAVGTAVTSKPKNEIKVFSPVLPTMSCASGKLNGTITSTGVSFKEFPLGCVSSWESCVVEGRNLPWSSTLTAGTAGNGTLTISSARLYFNCSKGLPCEVEASNVPLSVVGGGAATPALLKINSTFTRVAGCASSDQKRLEGSFEITAPKPIYVETQ